MVKPPFSDFYITLLFSCVIHVMDFGDLGPKSQRARSVTFFWLSVRENPAMVYTLKERFSSLTNGVAFSFYENFCKKECLTALG